MIYLEPPAYKPRGPDGKGWNRLRLDVMTPAAQCALRPLDISACYESATNRAVWGGGYGWCVNEGKCSECPIAQGTVFPKQSLPAPFGDWFYVREYHNGTPHMMHQFEKGWESYSFWGFTWADLRHDPHFYVAKIGRDQYSRWVLMQRRPQDELRSAND